MTGYVFTEHELRRCTSERSKNVTCHKTGPTLLNALMVCSMLEPGRAPSTTGTTTIIITAVLAYSHPQLSTLVTRPKSWLRANAHWISLMPLIKIALFMDLPVRNLCLRQFGSIRPATSRRPSHQIASMFPNLFTEFVSKPLTHSVTPVFLPPIRADPGDILTPFFVIRSVGLRVLISFGMSIPSSADSSDS